MRDRVTGHGSAVSKRKQNSLHAVGALNMSLSYCERSELRSEGAKMGLMHFEALGLGDRRLYWRTPTIHKCRDNEERRKPYRGSSERTKG